MFGYFKRQQLERERKEKQRREAARSSNDSSADIFTNPAYMGMPGNVYHSIASTPSYDSSPSSNCDSGGSGGDSGGGSCGGGGE